ncbi:MAG: hypothetical protein Q7U10_04065 [Thermodesulfovibrionia bacterium]|nr:hypothetical protein [Thermodesulfovibrionia bacterium]
MMFYNELKKAVMRHLIGGIVFAVILFVIIFGGRYGESLVGTVKLFEKQKENYKKMSDSVADLEKVMAQIDAMIPADYYSKTNREFILLSIGNIKSKLKYAEVKIDDFKEEGGEISMPLEIHFPVDDYTVMTESIAYIQSLKFPYFIFDGIEVARSKDNSEITCNIKGSIRLPAGRLSQRSGGSE